MEAATRGPSGTLDQDLEPGAGIDVQEPAGFEDGLDVPPEDDELLQEPTPGAGTASEKARERQEAIAGNQALEQMLSVDAPPIPEDEFTVTRLNWTVKLMGLEERELEAISKRAERSPNRTERERGETGTIRDGRRVNKLTVVAGMVEPNMQDTRLRDRYGTSERALEAWFLPGEIAQMADRIADLSGWAEDALERAKKS